MHQEVIKNLKKYSNSLKAKQVERFFKTGKGEYGEGDKFLGVTVPECRKIARQFFDLTLSEIEKLLQNSFHEIRLTALLILVSKYQKVKTVDQTEYKKKKQIFNFYIKNSKKINNWDLVDTSAYKIIGDYLLNKDRGILYKLAKSKNLWERRIAIISTFAFIKNKEHKDAFEIGKILMKDKEDLMHKAVGWMYREVGKFCGEEILTKFLDETAKKLPRTTLRYAIEHFSKQKREKYLKKNY